MLPSHASIVDALIFFGRALDAPPPARPLPPQSALSPPSLLRAASLAKQPASPAPLTMLPFTSPTQHGGYFDVYAWARQLLREGRVH